MKYLVTGATGKLGSKIVEELLKSIDASELAVSVRNPEKAASLKERGVDVRHGDFDQPNTLDEAFKGVERLLIISADGDNDTRIRQHTNAVEAAKRAGVSFIAYTSLADATDSENLMAPPHVVTEEAIVESGIPYAFLRNNWYLENELSSIQSVIDGAPWITAARDGKVGWALQQDYAEAAANILLKEQQDHAVYELSGPLHTQRDLVDALSEVLGREVMMQELSLEAYEETMRGAGLPEEVVAILAGIQRSIRQGTLEIHESDFEPVLGRPVTPLQDGIRQLLDR